MKTPQMEAALDGFAKTLFGRSRTGAIASAVCVICGGEATEFRNALSLKEYTISGMCQKCQDGVFGVDSE